MNSGDEGTGGAVLLTIILGVGMFIAAVILVIGDLAGCWPSGH